MPTNDDAWLFYHALAVLHAPADRTENAGALRQDWPRIPLPGWGVDATSSSRVTRRDAASTLRDDARAGKN